MVVGRPSAQAMEPVRFCEAKKRRWNAVKCVADGGGLPSLLFQMVWSALRVRTL